MFGKIYLDTAPIIYYLESSQQYVNVMQNFLVDHYANGSDFYTSKITDLEYLPMPLRDNRNDLVVAFDNFKNVLGVNLIDITDAVLNQAIKLRAKYESLKAADSIHIASAILTGCDVFVSNDKRLKRVTEINIVLVDDL